MLPFCVRPVEYLDIPPGPIVNQKASEHPPRRPHRGRFIGDGSATCGKAVNTDSHLGHLYEHSQAVSEPDRDDEWMSQRGNKRKGVRAHARIEFVRNSKQCCDPRRYPNRFSVGPASPPKNTCTTERGSGDGVGVADRPRTVGTSDVSSRMAPFAWTLAGAIADRLDAADGRGLRRNSWKHFQKAESAGHVCP
jgi:hypothetical protein